jgi:hypothetical protein
MPRARKPKTETRRRTATRPRATRSRRVPRPRRARITHPESKEDLDFDFDTPYLDTIIVRTPDGAIRHTEARYLVTEHGEIIVIGTREDGEYYAAALYAKDFWQSVTTEPMPLPKTPAAPEPEPERYDPRPHPYAEPDSPDTIP